MKLEAGAQVVYPNQGICRIQGVQAMEIGGHRAEFVTLVRASDGATVRVPKAKAESIGVRPLATPEEARAALFFLRDSEDDLDLDWKTRQKDHLERMTRGGLEGMVEVLRNLFALSELRALPQRERETYDQVRGLLIEELGQVLGLPPVAVEDQLDLALVPPPGGTRQAPPAKAAGAAKAAGKPAPEGGKPPARKKAATGEPGAGKPAKKAPAGRKAAKKAPASKKAKKPAAKKPARKTPAKQQVAKKAPAGKPAKKVASKKPARKTPAKKPGGKGGTR